MKIAAKTKIVPPPLYINIPNDFQLGDKLYLEGMTFVTNQGVRFSASIRDLKGFSPTQLRPIGGIVYQVVRTSKGGSK